MNKLPSLPDRISRSLLGVIGALNLLFLAAFVLSAAASLGSARAATVTCSGTDLIAAMKATDPAKYEALQKEAAKIPNGDSIFFRIERAGTKPSWLLGTMHVSDPRVLDLPQAAKAAYEGADTVVIETVDVLDQTKAATMMMQRLDLTMLPAGKKLSDYLSAGEMKIVEKGLEKRGIAMGAMARMRPWLISTMVALPPCEMRRRGDGAEMLDIKLATAALAKGKKLEGLETLSDQLTAMASLPIEFHAQSLVATLQLGDELEDVFETLITLYDNGNTGLLWPFLKTIDARQDHGPQGYAAFEQTMVNARNQTMADNAAPIIDGGNAFIAVGALHLPGKEGVVEYLRRAGYTVTAVH